MLMAATAATDASLGGGTSQVEMGTGFLGTVIFAFVFDSRVSGRGTVLDLGGVDGGSSDPRSEPDEISWYYEKNPVELPLHEQADQSGLSHPSKQRDYSPSYFRRDPSQPSTCDIPRYL